MKQQVSDWPDIRQLELDYFILAEISKRGRERDRLVIRFPRWKGLWFTFWTFSAHSQSATVSLVVLDGDAQNTKEETKVIHDIIKA